MGDWRRAGAAVRAERSRRQPNRADFAAETGLSVRWLSDLERGVRANFDDDNLSRLEHALGWAPGAVRDVALGKRLRRLVDEDLAAIQEAWPRLSADARHILAELARTAVRRRW